jgi:succinate dehydrogenase / fumarate reductase, membrane anchor subunit
LAATTDTASKPELRGVDLETARAEIPVDSGTWSWILQRVTAALLLIVLFIHIWVLHFANIGEVVSFETVSGRLVAAFFIAVDYSMLALVIYHGLNGVRNVVLDYLRGATIQRVVTWVLALFGLALFAYGVYGLAPFIIGRPIFSA